MEKKQQGQSIREKVSRWAKSTEGQKKIEETLERTREAAIPGALMKRLQP